MVVTLFHSDDIAPRLRIHTLLTTNGTDSIGSPLWQARESTLGCRTLSCTSLTLLVAQLAACGITNLAARIVWHPPTVSAAHTQSALPAQTLVLKTVSVEYGAAEHERTLVLFTGIGDFRLERRHLRAGAQQRGLSRRQGKCSSLNPSWCRPEQEFGMVEGMISPLLSPECASRSRLQAIFLLRPPVMEYSEMIQVALSLSLYESLLVPFDLCTVFLEGYARTAYPHIPLLWLEV